mgnify:CR=1 FL=1
MPTEDAESQAEVARLVKELESAEAYEQKLRQIIVDVRDELAAGHTANALSMLNQALSYIDDATDVVTSAPRQKATSIRGGQAAARRGGGDRHPYARPATANAPTHSGKARAITTSARISRPCCATSMASRRSRYSICGCGPGRDLKTLDRARPYRDRPRGRRALCGDGARLFRLRGVAAGFSEARSARRPCSTACSQTRRLFHVPSQELPRVLGELRATLKPRGVLFSSNPHGNDEEGWNRGRYGAYHRTRDLAPLRVERGICRARALLPPRRDCRASSSPGSPPSGARPDRQPTTRRIGSS